MTRKELERRPLLLISLGLILGISASVLIYNLAILLVCPFLLRARVPLLIFLAGTVLGIVIAPPPPPEFLKSTTYIESAWKVASLPHLEPYGQSCEIEHNGTRMRLAYLSRTPLCPGSTIFIRGKAKPPSEGSEDFFRSQRLVGKILADAHSVTILSPGPLLQQIGLNWRNYVMKLAQQELTKDQAAEFGALTFNTTSLLDDETRDDLKHTGTAHLVSASGLHVVIIATGIFALFQLLPIPRGWQIGAVVLILSLYAIATGINPPVVRSIIMTTCANVAWIVGREPDWPSALGLAALICIFWQPGVVFSIGFQLSFVVVLLLHMFCRRATDLSNWKAQLKSKLVTATQISVLASIIVVPLTAYYFGTCSPISVAANLLVVWVATPVVWLGMLVAPMGFLAPAVRIVFALAFPLLAYLDWIISHLSGVAQFDVPAFSGYWLVLVFGLTLALWRPVVRQP